MNPRFLFLVFIFFLVSCGALDQQDAEQKALEFVKSRVVFYSKVNDSSQSVADYSLRVNSAYKAENKWYVSVEVSSTINNTVKQKNLPVVIDSKTARIVEFNGMPVIQ